MPLYPDFTRTYINIPDILCGSVWLPFSESGLLCTAAGDSIALLQNLPAELALVSNPISIGTLNGVTYVACEIADPSLLPDAKPCELRSLYGRIPLQEWLIAGYAAQVLHWRKTSGYCPVCGSEMGAMGNEWSRKCTRCGHERYPQVSPALLILVQDGADRILMAHKPGWGDRYSIFAGFVLPGESLEECVHREVAEEAGVLVGELVYTGSQPWPFPHQLMIGFQAKYLSGEITIDQEELDDARWFHAAELPALPGALSLSRQMIDAWVSESTKLKVR